MKFSIVCSKITVVASLVLASALFNSCEKDIELTNLQPIVPTNLDANGGTWKPFILAKADEIALDAPKATNSTEYQAELTELKSLSTSLTADQQAAVTFWGAGAVYRWSEIARELAAKYNLPPVFNYEKGIYPVPDAANPLADPKFPFCNPPYASRAFAYVAVCQYDALVAAWNYKYKYNRQSPAKVDASVKASLPVLDLPAYPSEDAVVASASFEALRRLFPGEVDFLTAKLEEHKNARLWAGVNVRSDITAGEALGKAVATKVMARAGTDGMGAANNQALVPTLIADAKARGLVTEWKSQDLPARPPMLPNFGNVTPWNMTAAQKVAVRPPAPYAVGSTEFNKDLDELRSVIKNLTREQHRIATYWSDGVGTYTPPGHWNREASELARKYQQSEIRTARTMALLATAIEDAGISCWDTKYYYYTPRPFQIDSDIRTTIGLPNFPSYTSGHSTFSGAGAALLSYLFPTETERLFAKAKEASESRIYGGIHYRIDCEVGLQVGQKIADFAIQRAKADNGQ
ncbi:MAG: vanadium-dependent haloperoxidase [Spirosomataceae bacterium]